MFRLDGFKAAAAGWLIVTGTISAAAGTPADPTNLAYPPPATVLVIGDMHGSKEIPAAFLDLVDQILTRSKMVSVGLEIPPSGGAAGCERGRRRHVLGSFWTRSYQDGRSSQAMRSLVCALLARSKAGRVRLLFLDDETRNHPESFDVRAARKMAAELGKHRLPSVAMAGNFHARNDPESLVGIMKGMGLRVTSLTASTSNAVTWNCNPEAQCMARPMTMNFCRVTPDESYVLTREISDKRWDGCIVFPQLTSSSPVKLK